MEVIEYKVSSGDTLYIIATRFNVIVERILRLNPNIINPNCISVGQIIKIPARTEA